MTVVHGMCLKIFRLGVHTKKPERDLSIRHNLSQSEDDAQAVAPWYKSLPFTRAGSNTWFLTRLHTSGVFTTPLELFVL